MKKWFERVILGRKYVYGYDSAKNGDATVISKCYYDRKGVLHIVEMKVIEED